MSLIPVECNKVHYGIPCIPIFNFVFLTLRNPVPNVNSIVTYLLNFRIHREVVLELIVYAPKTKV